MGLNANIICIGRFNKGIVDCLEYGYKFYEDTAPGTIVAACILNCNTTSQSRQLAESLGVEPWDFNTHCINKGNVKWDYLQELSECCAEWNEIGIEKFKKLLDAGFICIYQPNG